MDYDSDSVFPRNRTGRDSEIRNGVRGGKVVETLCDETQVCCRVQYLDKDGLVSKPLNVKQFGSRSTSSFWCPKVGDDVNVVMLPNGDEEGYIDGSFYNTGNPPPITDPDTRHVTFADGTIIEYTEKAKPGVVKRGTAAGGAGSGTLMINSVGPINIKCAGVCYIEAPIVIIKAGSITLDSDVTITKTLTVQGTTSLQLASANPHCTNTDGSGNGS
jgi:phage baseplate assembly protein V